ncbi:MAG: lysophospholipid acyltransferase family protein [Acidobacteriota bacterium]
MKTVEYWLARFVLATLSLTPLSTANRLARFYVRLLDLTLPRLRRTALKNLEMAGFAGRERITTGVFDSIARLVVSFARFPQITRENVAEWIRYEGLENFEEARGRGRGVLVATGHFGNWELSAFAHAYLVAPMRIVVRPIDNPRIDALVESRRELSGNHAIAKKDAARGILRALAAGDAVGVLIDQNTTPDQGAFIDFFGVKACAGSAFVKLAHHSGAAVVPGYAVWSEKERRYVLHFEPAMEMTGDVQQDTQQVHARLEAAVRKHPDQWLWIHRRWKTRPPGEKPIYG